MTRVLALETCCCCLEAIHCVLVEHVHLSQLLEASGNTVMQTRFCTLQGSPSYLAYGLRAVCMLPWMLSHIRSC